MLFHFFTSLVEQYSFLNVFKYLTFRTGLSVITSLIVVFIIGAPLIKVFSEKMITGPIRQDGPIIISLKNLGHLLWVGDYNNWNYSWNFALVRFNKHLCLGFNFCIFKFR